jgi:hypothetical protein
MLQHCDRDEPILVSRTHRETHDGQELVFALLVFRPRHWEPMAPNVLFGEIALSPELYEKLVRDIGVSRPLPQEAKVPDEYCLSPAEIDDDNWASLLNQPPEPSNELQDDEFEMPF